MNRPGRLLVLALLLAGTVEARVWTSVSGATVEAEYTAFDGGQVQLRTADGRQFAIALESLSPDDQAHVRSLQAPSPAAAPEQPAGQPEAPAAPAINAASGIHFLSTAYESAAPVDTQPLEKLVAAEGEMAYFIALQYGPAATNVVLLGYASKAAATPPSRMYFLHPAGSAAAKPQEIRATRFGFPPHLDPNRRETVARFRLPPLAATFGDASVTHAIECYVGLAGRSDLIHAVNTVNIRRSSGAWQVKTGGMLSESAVGPGTPASPVALIRNPEVKGAFSDGRFYMNMEMGPFRFIPVQGLGRTIEITVVADETQRVVRRHRLPANEERAINLPSQKSSPVGWTPDKLKPKQSYTLNARLDLSPLFPPAEYQKSFTAE